MPTIDIALPDELTQALTPPVCADLRLPTVNVPSLTLPIGLELQGLADFTRGIPTNCSMNISIMAQLAPMMASMECLLKILKFFSGLVGSSPTSLIPNIISGLADLSECITMVTPLGLACFVKGLLELIASMLLCAVEALESVLSILSGLQISIADAQAAGNTELLAALQCAQENATTAADGAMQGLQPIAALLLLAGPFLQISGHSVSVAIPSPVPATDLAAMQTLLTTLGDVAQAIKTIADAIPC